MSWLRVHGLMKPLCLLSLSVALLTLSPTDSKAQFIGGYGMGYGGYGMGGYGMGYGGYGMGGYGMGYGGYGMGGYGMGGYGMGGYGMGGYGMAGYGGYGGAYVGYGPGYYGTVGGMASGYGGYPNQLFGIGTSALAVQSTQAETAIIRGSGGYQPRYGVVVKQVPVNSAIIPGKR